MPAAKFKNKKILPLCLVIFMLCLFSADFYGQANASGNIDVLNQKLEQIRKNRTSSKPVDSEFNDEFPVDKSISGSENTPNYWRNTNNLQDRIVVVAVTDECVKKMKKFPDVHMIHQVCDFFSRSRAAAVGIEFLFDTPGVDEREFVEFVERTPRMVLAADLEFDPNRLYKDWETAGNDFKIVKPYQALGVTPNKKGFINFDVMHGFSELRFHCFMLRDKEVFPSLALALVMTAENIEDYELMLNDKKENSKYALKFGKYKVSQKFVMDYTCNFNYIPFSQVYERSKLFFDSKDPSKLAKEYSKKIILIGDMTKNAKVYIKNHQSVYNLDLIANAILEIYRSK